MINSINIKNFESHKDTYIELDPGCNIVLGESDEGKSSIVRAIKWNSHNRPQGDGYRSDSLDPKNKKDKVKLTEVKIDYDGTSIVRARDAGSINHYVIDNQEPLKALRSDIPDEIQEITRMKSVNMQTQHPSDQYFLIGDRPGQVAKEFNKVAGLVVMDKASADINSKVRSCNSLIKISKNEIESRTEEIENTAWVDSAEKLSKKLNDFELRLNDVRLDCHELNLMIYDIEKTDNEIAEYEDVEEAGKTLRKLKKLNPLISEKKYELNELQELILALNNADSELNMTHDINNASTTLKRLNSEQSKITDTRNEIRELCLLTEKIHFNNEDLIWAESNLVESQKEYREIWSNQACPVCHRRGND